VIARAACGTSQRARRQAEAVGPLTGGGRLLERTGGQVERRGRTATDVSVAVRERDLDRSVSVSEGEHSVDVLLVLRAVPDVAAAAPPR
jgi:hypothetical protein